MNRERSLEIVRSVFGSAISTMKIKGLTYASDEDVLSNFKRTAEKLGLSSFQTLLVYMDKHLEALYGAVRKNPLSPSCEDGELKDKIKDVIVYCALFLCLLEETDAEES
ncbi:MAG: hypothetical protein QXI02_04035 [Candidatus Caldarchaeum sp.]